MFKVWQEPEKWQFIFKYLSFNSDYARVFERRINVTQASRLITTRHVSREEEMQFNETLKSFQQ